MIRKYPLIRTLYSDKQLTLQLFVPPPETIEYSSKYTVNFTSTLFLQMVGGKDLTLEELKSRRFAIKPSNLYDVVVFFNTILSWFEEIDDLYLEGPEGNLVFNTKYDKLSVLTQKGYFDDCRLKAVPAIVEVAQGQYVEGCYLYINRVKNVVILQKHTIQGIFNVLRTFSFTSETMLTFELLKHSINTGAVISSDEFKKRLENNGAKVIW